MWDRGNFIRLMHNDFRAEILLYRQVVVVKIKYLIPRSGHDLKWSCYLSLP